MSYLAIRKKGPKESKPKPQRNSCSGLTLSNSHLYHQTSLAPLHLSVHPLFCPGMRKEEDESRITKSQARRTSRHPMEAANRGTARHPAAVCRDSGAQEPEEMCWLPQAAHRPASVREREGI